MSRFKKPVCAWLACCTMLSLIFSVSVSVPNKALAASDVTINLAAEKQVIRGFGGINHPVWAGDLTAAQRETAFGNGDNQLGFSVLRIHVDEDRNQWSKEVETAKSAIARGAIVLLHLGIPQAI